MRDVPDDQLAQHISALRRYARVLAGNPTEADDLVQECLARALVGVKAWRKIRDMRAYLFTIMHNLFVDELARRSRRKDDVCIDDIKEGLLSCTPSQGRALELLDMYRGLQKLPDEQRETLLLVGLDGMTYREVADIVGVPIGTVMSRLSRARESLRRYMESGRIKQYPRKVPHVQN